MIIRHIDLIWPIVKMVKSVSFKNGYTFSESLELIAHESFHAVQEAEGQGEKSIFNEVEAHVFGFIIQRNWLASTNTDSVQGVSQANAGRPNDAGRRIIQSYGYEQRRPQFQNRVIIKRFRSLQQ